jgi:hypothetical protein
LGVGQRPDNRCRVLPLPSSCPCQRVQTNPFRAVSRTLSHTKSTGSHKPLKYQRSQAFIFIFSFRVVARWRIAAAWLASWKSNALAGKSPRSQDMVRPWRCSGDCNRHGAIRVADVLTRTLQGKRQPCARVLDWLQSSPSHILTRKHDSTMNTESRVGFITFTRCLSGATPTMAVRTLLTPVVGGGPIATHPSNTEK